MNPYSGVGFFEFFGLLFQRICSGAIFHPATDEVQLVVLACCALACGLVGPFLVLKRMSMFANSLSHTSLLGVVVVFLIAGQSLPTLLIGALLSAILTAGLTAGLTRAFRLQEDASIGLVFNTLFAIGVILVTLFTNNAHLSTEAVTGNCDALRLSDLRLAGGVALLNALVIAIFYRRLLVSAFDEPFSKVKGILGTRLIIYLLTALTCIASFRAVGVLVVLALLVGPYLTARLFSNRLHRLLFWTPLLGITACAIGVALSRSILSTYSLPLSTSGLIAATIAAQFALALSIKMVLGRSRAYN